MALIEFFTNNDIKIKYNSKIVYSGTNAIVAYFNRQQPKRFVMRNSEDNQNSLQVTADLSKDMVCINGVPAGTTAESVLDQLSSIIYI